MRGGQRISNLLQHTEELTIITMEISLRRFRKGKNNMVGANCHHPSLNIKTPGIKQSERATGGSHIKAKSPKVCWGRKEMVSNLTGYPLKYEGLRVRL